MSYLVSPQYGSQRSVIRRSMRETLEPAETPMFQHFVEWFSGDSLDSIWSIRDIGGGSNAMNDAVNGGFKLTTGTSTNNHSTLHFNDISHYSHNSSVWIAVVTRDAADTWINCGLTEQFNVPSDTHINYDNDSTQSFIRLQTGLNNANTNIITSVATGAERRKIRLELRASSGLMWIDDALAGISTTNLPDVVQQTFLKVATRAAAAKDALLHYMECYNT